MQREYLDKRELEYRVEEALSNGVLSDFFELLPNFLDLADLCSLQDVWTMKLGDVPVWQYLIYLPPWFHGVNSL